MKRLRARYQCGASFILLSLAIAGLAVPALPVHGEDTTLPTLRLFVVINGRPVPDDAGIVRLKRGSTNEMSVFVIQPDGKRRDVTLNAGLFIPDFPGQPKFLRGKLTVEPRSSNDSSNSSATDILPVYFFIDQARKIYGLKIVSFRLID